MPVNVNGTDLSKIGETLDNIEKRLTALEQGSQQTQDNSHLKPMINAPDYETLCRIVNEFNIVVFGNTGQREVINLNCKCGTKTTYWRTTDIPNIDTNCTCKAPLIRYGIPLDLSALK